MFRLFPVSMLRLAWCTAAFSLAGCADTVARLIQPYKVEIQQGNFISREQVAALREGMTRDQVRFVLGSPMLQPAFRGERWEYPFYIRRTSGQVIERKFTAWFKDDRLVRWEGDEMPSERPRETASEAPVGKPLANPSDVQPEPPAPLRDTPGTPGPGT